MNNKDDFKKFVKKHPELIEYVNKKEKTWQEFYELWDLFGEDINIWDKYKKIDKEKTNITGVNDVLNMVKNIKPETLQSSISSIQKFLGYVSGFVGDKKQVNSFSKFDRPINKIYED